MGVLSSCLAMSATEETVYSQQKDEMMRENAAVSRMRILKLLEFATRQPGASKGVFVISILWVAQLRIEGVGKELICTTCPRNVWCEWQCVCAATVDCWILWESICGCIGL